MIQLFILESVYTTVMPVAHVLVKYNEKNSSISLNCLQTLHEIKTIDSTCGLYDVVIQIEAKSKEWIMQIVSRKIRNMDKIQNTITLLDS